jgi:BirA family biotin operon repressor/biotin-[acetyl-CoA-carboxylase] ligase
MCADGPQEGDPASFTTVPAPAETRFGPIRRFAEIDSTNRYLLERARAGAAEGEVTVADYQSAGRGRLGRRWEAPPGSNLLVSVLLRPVLETEELHLCTVAVALAAAAACERGAGVVAELKWPNDLMVRGRKLGGILAEALPADPGPGTGPGPGPTAANRDTAAVVVGLGLNVRWPAPDGAGETARAEELDEDLDDGSPPARAEPDFVATSLWQEAATAGAGGTALEPLALLDLLLEDLEGRLVDLAEQDGRMRLANEYRRRCDTVGKSVRVSLPGEVFTGTATDVTLEGHLIVDVGVCLRTVAAGDVVHLRDPG